MTRTPVEIAESLYSRFEQSSKEFQQELYQYGGKYGDPPASKSYVDAALSAFAAALGSEQQETLALAGITPVETEDPQQCQLVVFTYGLLLHTTFAITGGDAPAVQVIPRNSISSITVTRATPYDLPNRQNRPDRLKFTVAYQGGLVLDFPLKGNQANDATFLGEVLDTLRADLNSKA